MKYKVGDDVLIRSDLVFGKNYGGFTVDSAVTDKRGKIRTIEKVGDVCYTIDGYPSFTDEMIERKISFTKDDLKVGYVVETKGGELKMVMEVQKGLVLAANGACINLDNYSEELTNIQQFTQYDIVKVYGFTAWSAQALRVSASDRYIIWERKEEPIEITIEEIAKLKGVSADRIRIKE